MRFAAPTDRFRLFCGRILPHKIGAARPGWGPSRYCRICDTSLPVDSASAPARRLRTGEGILWRIQNLGPYLTHRKLRSRPKFCQLVAQGQACVHRLVNLVYEFKTQKVPARPSLLPPRGPDGSTFLKQGAQPQRVESSLVTLNELKI